MLVKSGQLLYYITNSLNLFLFTHSLLAAVVGVHIQQIRILWQELFFGSKWYLFWLSIWQTPWLGYHASMLNFLYFEDYSINVMY